MGSRLEKNSSEVRKRIEGHTFTDETGEEYEASSFGGFGDYFRRKKIKLQNIDAELRSSTDKPQIFKGVVAHVSGYTVPPLSELRLLLVQHGAGFLQYLDYKTMATHIIVSTLSPKKAVEYRSYRVVRPEWVTDSIKEGKLLPWHDYKVISEGPGQKTLKFDGDKMTTQHSPQRSNSYREHSKSSHYAKQPKTQSSSGIQYTPSRAEAATQFDQEQDDIPMIDSPALPEGESHRGIEESRDVDAMRLDDLNANDSLQQLDVGQDLVPNEDHPKEPLDPPKNMTSEEHNAWLLSDPRIRMASSANPDFLKQFYSESRLHHLSTWKAELKSKMQRMAAERKPATTSAKRTRGSRRYVMHVDFDSFFCAVSLKQHPEFADKPAVVAHGTGSGSEIASCNYPAREFGVKNGMWMKRAMELCPELKVLPYDFPGYEEASRLFYESILDVGGVVQSVSVDEALVDITHLVLSATGSNGHGIDEGSIWREQEKADEIANNLRAQIKSKTGCSVSIGLGANILLAKVALRKAKPAGQYHIKEEEVLDILGELKVEQLPGVAYSIGGKLEEMGVKLVKDVRQISKERLSSVLGPKTGEKLCEYSRGIDRAEVGEQPPRKSVSAEVSWGIRFINQEEAEEFVFNLCKELERRLVNEQVKGKNLTVKIMRRSLDAPLDPAKHLGHGKCDTFNKSCVFGVATHSASIIGPEAVSILRSFKFSPGDLRGLGLQMTKLEPIKSATGPDGSQKKLSFAAFGGPSSVKPAKVDPIEEAQSLVKEKDTPGRSMSKDPIADDPLTPHKPKPSPMHPALALAKANEGDRKATTPLNMTGTQFILPSNADPAVIAELPSDIRRALRRQSQAQLNVSHESPYKSRSQSPTIMHDPSSRIYPEEFDVFPEDMETDGFTSYRRKGGQNVLPQSPRKDRLLQSKKPSPATRGRRRGGAKVARERRHDIDAGLLQTNFRQNPPSDNEIEEEPEELDPEFLSELPEDVRREVVEDHRRRRLAYYGSLDINAPAWRNLGIDFDDLLPGGQTKLQFPVHPQKASFGNGPAMPTKEMKGMLESWHKESKDSGPHREDVAMFEEYLRKVILEERDMEKPAKLVRWLDWIVEADNVDCEGKQSWQHAIREIKDEVQEAVKQRGLAPLKF